MTTSVKETTILMIEDDLTLCELIGSFLKKKGYQFIYHSSCDGAIERIRESKPDLIILDLHFPDGNGLHLCKLIKEDEEIREVPILVLTTRDYPVEKEIAMASGVTDFYHKPVDYELFAQKIDEILGNTIEIIFWGVRGSIPCPGSEYAQFGGNTMCVQIKLPGQKKLLILDGGSGIRTLGNELVKLNSALDGRIFFTHAHWDHIQGFPFFKPLYSIKNRFDIYMPPQMNGGTKEVLLDQMSYTYFPVTSQMLQAKLEYHTQMRKIQHFDGYSIQYMSANHPVETAIFKIQIGKKIIIFCPDNELHTQFIGPGENNAPFLDHFDRFISGADILIHDAQFDEQEYIKKINWGHSAWEQVVERAKKNNIKHLILTHYDPDANDDYLNEMEEKAREMLSDSGTKLEMSKEGKSFRLTKRSISSE